MEKKTFQALAEDIINRYISGWKLHLNYFFHVDYSGVYTKGKCRYDTKIIDISYKHILDDKDEDIIYTLLHEIAHAIHLGHNHDFTWQLGVLKLIRLEGKALEAKLEQKHIEYLAAKAAALGFRWL